MPSIGDFWLLKSSCIEIVKYPKREYKNFWPKKIPYFGVLRRPFLQKILTSLLIFLKLPEVRTFLQAVFTQDPIKWAKRFYKKFLSDFSILL